MNTNEGGMPTLDVRLSIWGRELNPADLSQALNLAPTRSYFKGVPVKSVDGNEFLPKTGVWELDLTQHIHSEKVEEFLTQLVSQWSRIGKSVRAMDGVEGAHVTCAVCVKSNVVEIELSSGLLGEIAKLGFDIRLVII